MLISLILSLSFGPGPVYAHQAEQIVVNSADWIDVYSAMLYANLNGVESKFVNSDTQAMILTSVLDRTKRIHLIESESKPIIAGYKSTLEREGFDVVSVMHSKSGKSLNLELASRIDTKKFIVIDDSYGYNAISVAPYAVKSNSWVLFADKDNINDVHSFLKGRGVEIESMIIYGRVDRAVKDRLKEFAPELIDEGSRFDDNIEIVKRYMAISPSSQAVLTNGDFIEDEVVSGRNPVLFIGVDNVPDQTVSYVKQSGIKIGVVIGNELINSAQRLKERTGIYIFMKFGQGRATTGGFSLVEELDKFYLPRYELSMDVLSVNYNEATQKLEVLYKNDAVVGIFFTSSIAVYADNERIATVGDSIPKFIDANTEFGAAYEIDIGMGYRDKLLKASAYIEYGEAPKSLNKVLQKDLVITIITVPDKSKIEISKVVYDKNTERIKVYIPNRGDVPCYAYPEVKLIVDREEEILRVKEPIKLDVGDNKEATYRIKLSDADITDNQEQGVFIHTLYGERKNLLVKSLSGTYPLEVTGGMPIIAITIVMIIAAVLVTGLWFVKRWRKKK